MRKYVKNKALKDSLLKEIESGNYPVCWHILGQGLSDTLSSIIEDQIDEIKKMQIEKENSPTAM